MSPCLEPHGRFADDRRPARALRDAVKLDHVVGARHDRGNDLARRGSLGDPGIRTLDVKEERAPQSHGAQQVGQDVAAHRIPPLIVAPQRIPACPRSRLARTRFRTLGHVFPTPGKPALSPFAAYFARGNCPTPCPKEACHERFPARPPTPDFAAIKTRQQATWASGDFGRIGVLLQIVGETLCEAVDLRAGEKVIDVAAGNGNASLAAARRYADVTSTDYVPELLAQGHRRAEAEGLPMRTQVADAENLPFGTASSTSRSRPTA